MIFRIIGPERFPGAFFSDRAATADDSEAPICFIATPGWSAGELEEAIASTDELPVVSIVVTDTTDCPAADAETSRAGEICTSHGITLTHVTFAPIAGTGMTGRWRDTVNAIYRGIYCHVVGNTARASIIHALDAAEVAVRAAMHGGHHYVSDNRNPTVDAIADALARRIDDKRIAVLKPRQARTLAWLTDLFTLGHAGARKRLERDTTDAVFTSTQILDDIDYQLRDTVGYLTSHTYTDEDI